MFKDTDFVLYLIRHGQSIINAQPDLMGQKADTPLTETGKDQAQRLHDKFKFHGIVFDRYYSSTYVRAFDTAKIVKGKFNKPIIMAHELREYDAGDWIGASRTATLTQDIKFKMNSQDHSFLPPNGESMHQVQRRASEWLENNILYNNEIAEASQLQKPYNIAVFSHGMTIKCLLQYIMGFDKSFTWKVNIHNTSVSKFSFNSTDGWRLYSINDCSHLG